MLQGTVWRAPGGGLLNKVLDAYMGRLRPQVQNVYTYTREKSALLYSSSLKKDPFRVEPPRIAHYREYLPPRDAEEGVKQAGILADFTSLVTQSSMLVTQTL